MAEGNEQPKKVQVVGGNPGPLGLCGFALTTFVLSVYNAGIFGMTVTSPPNAVVGLALFYGGMAQGLAGVIELVAGNTVGGTAFTSYAAFWLSYAVIILPEFGVADAYSAAPPGTMAKALGVFLLAWTIFTLIMLLVTLRTTAALASLFAFLSVTFALLTIAEYTHSNPTKRAGGFMGIFTAIIAWYIAVSGLLDATPYPVIRLPLGVVRPRATSEVSSVGVIEAS